MSTSLDVLNVGLGDLKLRWNPEDAADEAKAKETIERLLRDGYVICIERPDGSYRRVKRFDAKQDCYVISEAPSEPKEEETPAKKSPKRKRGNQAPIADVHVPREGSKATAIGRSAGG